MQVIGRSGVAIADIPAREPVTPEVLREHCVGEIFAYLSRRIKRREDAEDLALEVFIAAYQSPRPISPAELRPWLFGIARRKLADYLRRGSRRPEALEGEANLSNLSDPDEPGKEYLRREAILVLRRIVDGLPQDQKEALLMQHLEELSIAEIAGAMSKSLAAVNSLLQRARATIYTRGKTYFLEPQETSR